VRKRALPSALYRRRAAFTPGWATMHLLKAFASAEPSVSGVLYTTCDLVPAYPLPSNPHTRPVTYAHSSRCSLPVPVLLPVTLCSACCLAAEASFLLCFLSHAGLAILCFSLC
jgi:hypothetical protein